MAHANSGITSHETLNRLISLRDELGASGHLVSPVRAREYREALAHCIMAIREIAGPPPRRGHNVVEMRPS